MDPRISIGASLVYQVRCQEHAGRRLHRMLYSVAQRIRARTDEIAANPYGKHPDATRLRGTHRDAHRERPRMLSTRMKTLVLSVG